MPAPDAVFVFIKISYKIFYNRFRVIRGKDICDLNKTFLNWSSKVCTIMTTNLSNAWDKINLEFWTVTFLGLA